ncbi:MAG: EamA family transporter [Bacteroidota bacterium]
MSFLLLAIGFSTCIFITFKIFQRFEINLIQAITVNYIVAVSSGILSLPHSYSFNELMDREWIYYALGVGVLYVLIFFVFANSAQKAGVAITAVSSKMSLVIPVVFGFLLFNEQLNIQKILGVSLALIAFYFTFQQKSKTNRKYLFLPLLLFLGTGTADTLQKKSQTLFVNGDEIMFLVVTFSVALLIGFAAFLVIKSKNHQKIHLKNIIGGTILGLFNWVSTLFFIKGLNSMEVSIFIPVFNASIVTNAAIIGFLFFNEKLRKINWAGIMLAIFSIILIAIS